MRKLLVITGASKGIGLAAVQCFARQGYDIINISRSACPEPGIRNFAIDLLDHDWPRRWQTDLLEQTGEPEQIALVHNAAMLTKDSVADMDDDLLRQVLQLNVVAAAQLNRLLIPQMQAGSSILYVGSTLGTKAVANTHAYVVSKHAVVGQMRATCQDLVGTGIHTACICPGFTETEMLQAHLGENPELYRQITATIAFNRLVQPAEIADTLWFCSQNAVINGALIDANLGQIER
ncbi:MAG: SDR family oxidoreductase [Gammaproteobacteria bacterium]|nr:SDR family oxidoreductase [Gammaproteobacteria bacterium]